MTPNADYGTPDERVVDEAERVVHIARILREADWPGYRDTDDGGDEW